MLISDQYKFIFVHVSKTAGTSVNRTFEPYANEMDRSKLNKALSKSGIRRDYQKRYFAIHAYISEAQKYIPEDVFNDFFKFAFVRNPWDWIVSMHSFLKQNTDHRHSAMVQKMSFSEYVDFEIARNKRSQHEFICDKNGNLAVDFIGRFESLEDDFNTICQKIGLDLHLPHLNPSKHKDFRDYYDSETIDKVAKHWRKDIELFGYDFDNKG